MSTDSPFSASNTESQGAEGQTHLVSDLSAARLLRRLDAVNWDFPGHNPRPGTQGLHALHWYPANFPAALPATMLDILIQQPGRVLDPFCGSGVSLLEAWARGHDAFGVDNNRFAVELVDAKTSMLLRATAHRGQELAAAYLEYVAARGPIRDDVRDLCARAGMQPEVVDWFLPAVLVDIVVALDWLGTVVESAALWVILSSLLHRSSELRHVHYTYVVDRSKAKHGPTSTVNLPAAFSEKLRRSFKDAQRARDELGAAGAHLAATPRPTVLAGPAQDIVSGLQGHFDAVVTSPPYFGMNDYVRSQYLSWLVQPWDGYEEDRLSESGQRRGRRNPATAGLYVSDVATALLQAAARLRPGGHLAVVIGASRSALSVREDPVGAVRTALSRSGLESLWTGKRRVRYRKINNSPECEEEIWVMRV